MDIQFTQVLALTLYKIVSLIVGVFLCFMGYKLFAIGIWGNAGDAEGAFGNNRLVLKKAAPGTFFVLLGTIVIGLTIIKGMNYEKIPNNEIHQEKPTLTD